MSNHHIINDLAFLHAFNQITFLGPKRIDAIYQHYSSFEAAWVEGADQLLKVLQLDRYHDRLKEEMAKIDPWLEWVKLEKENFQIVSRYQQAYPILLNQLTFPPPLLYYRGKINDLEKPAVAIVGSRRCTFYGKEVAHRLAGELVDAGISVISGMALGVDTAAHTGALEKRGYTVAVLGCGLDQCYPPANRDLMEQIANSGAVISEFPPGTKPLPAHFPQRNRIISGLSLGIVVVEATAKSGALITADYALEQNREVFAVPGNIGSPYSRGSHRLIKEGARLVESAADIIEELNLGRIGEQQLSFADLKTDLSEQEKELLVLIPYQELHIDEIIRLSKLSAASIATMLLTLELKQVIRQSPGKHYCRI